MNTKPLWSLLRPVLWPTAVADAFLGTACSILGGADMNLLELPFAAGFSLFLYAGGMVLNDICDAESDAAEERERPIPSGDITKGQAVGVFIFLWVCAGFMAYQLPRESWALAGSCAAMVVLYNLTHKRLRVLSPFLMGGARALDVATAAVAAGLSVSGILSNAAVLAVIGSYATYVVAVTFFSLLEDKRDAGILLFSLLSAFLALACALPLKNLTEPGQPHLWFFMVLFTILSFVLGAIYFYFSKKHQPALSTFVPFALAPLTLLGGTGLLFLTISEKGSPVMIPGLVLSAFYPLLAGVFSLKAAKLIRQKKGD
ncbi:MAG: hypothetical protein Kow00107_08600 [Planctomycetota bacterium]